MKRLLKRFRNVITVISSGAVIVAVVMSFGAVAQGDLWASNFSLVPPTYAMSQPPVQPLSDAVLPPSRSTGNVRRSTTSRPTHLALNAKRRKIGALLIVLALRSRHAGQ